MIQDIFPHKLDNHFYPARKASANSFVMAFRHQDILVKGEEFPRVSQMPEEYREKLIYLFAVDEDYYFFLDARDESMALPEGYEFVNVRSFRRSGIAEKKNVFLAFTALQLANWYRGNVPAVIVGITNGDKILVTKYKTGFAHFALVAGFTEIGETLEETVAREAMEETGLKVKNIRYYKSQPWGIVDDILVGFYCDVDGDDTINMDEGELKVAEWRSREEIELQPDDYSLTNEMMKMFKEGNA